MRLKKGDKAPDFIVTDLDGKKIDSKDFGDSKILLSFFRYASCPLCNLRVSLLIQKYDELREKELVLYAFFESPKESMLNYVAKQKPPFPLIPDPKRKVYKKYGIEKSWLKYIKGGLTGKMRKARKKGFKIGKAEGQVNLVPGEFIIRNGIIELAYYGKDIGDHLPFEDIFDYLDNQ